MRYDRRTTAIAALGIAAALSVASSAHARDLSMEALEAEVASAPGGELLLAPRPLVQWVLMRNADVLIANEGIRIAEGRLQYASAEFSPEVFVTLRAGEERRRNSLDRPDQPILIDEERYAEAGIRKLTGTGAELTLSYTIRDRFSNMSSGDDPEGYDDATGNFSVEVRQPMLRGVGAAGVRARLAQANHELEIARQELRQRLLMGSYEALTLYWQLYRAERTHAINRASLANARALREESVRLVEAGRLAPTTVVEARSIEHLREAELASSGQLVTEVASELRRLLNLDVIENGEWSFRPVLGPDPGAANLPTDFEGYLQAVLDVWPDYRIAQERIAVSEQTLRIARDAGRSQLDLVLSYGQNSRDFNSSWANALEQSMASDYPEWRVGIEWSTPLDWGGRADAQETIARSQIIQSRIEFASVRTQLSNQLHTRVRQVEATRQELAGHESNVGLLEELLAAERAAFSRGERAVRAVIEREDTLNRARLRAIDAAVRFELAKAALGLSDGSLTRSMGVEFALESEFAGFERELDDARDR